MNKKGGIFQLFGIGSIIITFVIVAFVIVLIAAVWLNGFGKFAQEIVNIEGTFADDKNLSTYTSTTFGNLDIGFQQLRWITLVIIIGMMIGILLSAAMVRVHPAFFILYVLLTLGTIIFSIFISNSYSSLLDTVGLGETLGSFKGSSYILSNLPIWTTVIAFIGGIIMFVGISRDSEQGGFL